MLDEARLWMVLTVWQLPLGDPAAGQIHEGCPARGRALVERENEIGSHGLSLVDTADGTGFARSGRSPALVVVVRPQSSDSRTLLRCAT